MVLYAWYPTIWYQVYGTISKITTKIFHLFFWLWYRVLGTLPYGTKPTEPCTNKVHIFVRSFVRTCKNTKNKILEYVTGKYHIVWYHIKKNRYYFVCTVLSCTGTISKKGIDTFLKKLIPLTSSCNKK